MKKNTLTMISALAVSAVCLTGCGKSSTPAESGTAKQTASAPTENTDKTETTEAAEVTSETSETERETASEAVTEAAEADGSVKPSIEKFPGGVWIGTSEKYGRRYYSFYTDPVGGNLLFQDSGLGVGFEYEITGNTAVFHLGDTESANSAEIVSESDKKIELVWNEDGKKVPEILEFHSPDVETFDFTEDETLKEKALNYYEMLNGTRPKLAETEPAENGMILVHVHDEDGSHEAFYTVSPLDCKGTDTDGTAVDLTDVPLG